MTHWLKKFWNEFGTREFLTKYLLPAGGLFFTWGFLGHLYTQSLTLDDLVRATGTVQQIEVVFEQGTKAQYKYYPLRIRIDGLDNSFRVHDNFKGRFKELQSKISTGDTISVYTRTSGQTAIGWGQRADIFQIEKDQAVLFDIKWMMKYQKTQGDSFLIFGLICWIIYIGVMIERRKGKRQR